MKLEAIVLGILTFLFFTVAHAQPNSLCQFLDSARRDIAAVPAPRLEQESNPLKRDAILQAYQQRRQQIVQQMASAWDDWVTKGTFNNYTGVVSRMDVGHYSSGKALHFQVALPCNATINVTFEEPSYKGYFNGTLLAPWLSVLERLSLRDTVTVSGRFDSNGSSPWAINYNDLKQPTNVTGQITKLCKGKC